MVCREAQAPISTEFQRVIREVNLGLPLDDALATRAAACAPMTLT
jgi:Flp pilus assembly protein TadB